jgi:hypothetical protein
VALSLFCSAVRKALTAVANPAVLVLAVPLELPELELDDELGVVEDIVLGVWVVVVDLAEGVLEVEVLGVVVDGLALLVLDCFEVAAATVLVFVGTVE